MTAKVTIEAVERMAELASLELTPEEIPGMVGDLNAILDYIAELNELDTAGVAPLAQISEIQSREIQGTGLADAGLSAGLRHDAVLPSLNRASVLPEAPESDGRFFKVPKVIER